MRDEAFKIASDPRHDGYERGLASIVYKLFEKKSAGSGAIKVLLTRQLGISKMLKKSYFNLFGKNYRFFHLFGL